MFLERYLANFASNQFVNTYVYEYMDPYIFIVV